MIKRFLVFIGDDYYPSGGADDYCESFDGVVSAIAKAMTAASPCRWWHVADAHDNMRVVACSLCRDIVGERGTHYRSIHAKKDEPFNPLDHEQSK